MSETITEENKQLLDHEKLHVYQIAIEFVMLADEIAEQLHRAALSISLNIAEGAGEYAIEEKARFYRMAKRSAAECGGILDVCQRLQLIDPQCQIVGRKLIIRIVSMLIKMIRK